jgi:acyl-CoA thioester hydrolase
MTETSEHQPALDAGFLNPVFVHFDDLDSQGLVHNSRFAVMLERSLTDFWESQGYTYRADQPRHPDTSVIVAEYSITYRAPVRGTGDIYIHFWVEKLGRTSVVYAFRVLSADKQTVHAQGRRVHIHFDPETLSTAPWADETRAIYGRLMLP